MTSRPTTSRVLKVALAGLPILFPVRASTVSAERLKFSACFKTAIKEKTPILFATKAGLSLA